METRTAILVNPNTDAEVTARMLAIARRVAGDGLVIDALTPPNGVPLITDEAELAAAAEAVKALAPTLRAKASGVIVAGFGDPGVAGLRAALDVPVVGIGEAALRKAASGGRRFCVATTTPELADSIDRQVARLGLAENYAGVVLTQGEAVTVSSTPHLLERELALAIDRAIRDKGVEAVAIGGGPLGQAGRALAAWSPVAVVEPVEAGVLALLALSDRNSPQLVR